jgi:hypothetical protein
MALRAETDHIGSFEPKMRMSSNLENVVKIGRYGRSLVKIEAALTEIRLFAKDTRPQPSMGGVVASFTT